MFTFSSTLLIFVLLGHTLSAPTGTFFQIRDNQPSDNDLFASCPGGPGSKNVERADKCTLINIVNNPDTHLQYNVGNVQGNCEGGTNPVSLTVGGESTTETTTTASADLGIDFEGISIGGGIESSKSTSSTKSNSTTITVNPGRQAVMTMSVLAHSQSGNVQVNYGDRVDGHFIWFTGTVITQTIPTDEITFDVHETKCGTDPLNFTNTS